MPNGTKSYYAWVEREFGEKFREKIQRDSFSRVAISIFYEAKIFCTHGFLSVLRDYQLWNKLYLILVGERFIEFNKNILWTLFYGPTLCVVTVPRALTQYSWPQKGLDYFLLALPVSWAKTHAKQLPNSFYLRFCVWLNNFIIDTLPISPLPLCFPCLPLCCAIIVENCKL